MIRVLIAVDDSAPALAAANLAIELARTQSALLRFVTVSEAGSQSVPVLDYVLGLADKAGVQATGEVSDGGQPFEVLLASAHAWKADVIVMGRSDIARPGQPHVGSQTEHLLEFTDIPVLVVPEESH